MSLQEPKSLNPSAIQLLGVILVLFTGKPTLIAFVGVLKAWDYTWFEIALAFIGPAGIGVILGLAVEHRYRVGFEYGFVVVYVVAQLGRVAGDGEIAGSVLAVAICVCILVLAQILVLEGRSMLSRGDA